MANIGEEIRRLHALLPQGVQLVAVSKFHPAEAVKEAYDAGQRIFGESRVQEMLQKIPMLPDDIRWHFIGHLQTNKVRQIIGKTAMIESVDSEKLLDLIDAESRRAGTTTGILMQVHVAKEETKFGFYPEEILDYFKKRRFEGMASNTDDTDRVRADFAEIASLARQIKDICPDLRGFGTVSMGMSGDWQLAVEGGSTLVRIGTAIFGQRNY